MSFYLSTIMSAIDKKKDTLKQLLKKLPLVCHNLYGSFVALPKLNPVRLTEDTDVFELPNEFEIQVIDELTFFFHELTEASSFLKIKDLVQRVVLFCQKRSETGSFDVMVTFLVHMYMDYSYFIQSNSKDIEQIKLVFNVQNATEFESFKKNLNCTTIQLIDSWKAHGELLSTHYVLF